MKNIKGIIGAFVLFAIIGVVLFCTAIPVESQSSDNSAQQGGKAIIAEGYARRYGVSIDEALRRLDLQNSFPDLEPQLERNEAGTFGGLWIQHEPEYRVVVAFTHDGEKTITKYSDYTPVKIASYVEVRIVDKSMTELLDDQKALLSSLNKLDIKADSRVDVKNNCVSIDIIRSDEAKFKSVEQKGELTVPEGLKINLVDHLAKLTTDIYGGLSLLDYLGRHWYTSGFAVINGAGTKGIATCAHNPTSIYFASTNLPLQSSSFSGSCDCAWYTCPGLTVQNKIKIMDNGTTIPITAFKSRSSQVIGSTMAKYGCATGYTYGELTSKTAAPTSVPNVSSTWMEVTSYWGETIVGPGDSGCPWYTEGEACGIQHGMFGDGDRAYYMAVDYLSNIGVSIMTAP